jgi:hypothetical protein
MTMGKLKSVEAALARNRASGRSDGDVLRQVESETDHCEARGIISPAEARDWRDGVRRARDEGR